MTQDATVTEVFPDGYATVTVERAAACGGACGACGGCSLGSGSLSVRAKNSASASVGDSVVIESGTGSVLRSAALVYALPLAAFFLGYLLSALFGLGETGGIILSFSGLALGGLAAVIIGRAKQKRAPESYDIVEIR